MHASTRTDGDLRIDPDDIHDDYDRAGFDDLTDAQLFDRAAAVVALPARKRPTPSSCTRRSSSWLAASSCRSSLPPPAGGPRAPHLGRRPLRAGRRPGRSPQRRLVYDRSAAARHALLAALAAGDLEGVDVAASQFLADATVDEVMALAEPTIDMLSAAGHAPIGFFLAGRLATTSRVRAAAAAPDACASWRGHPSFACGGWTMPTRRRRRSEPDACARPHAAARPARQRLHLPDRPPGRRRRTRTRPADRQHPRRRHRGGEGHPAGRGPLHAPRRSRVRPVRVDPLPVPTPRHLRDHAVALRPAPGRRRRRHVRGRVPGRRGRPRRRPRLGARTDVDEAARRPR